jgi:sugar phosphate isomerase/epimerase
MKLGIGTYCYMWSIGFKGAEPARPMTAMDLLGKAQELGVRVVQMGPNLPMDKLPEAEVDRFARQAQAWGIDVELCTRGLETDHLQRQVALAQRVGARILRTIPELGGQNVDPRVIPDYMRAILPTLEGAAVRLGFENGKIPAVDLRSALEAVDSPWFGIVLDTVNSLAVPEGWKHVAEILAPYTICLHMKEFIVQRVWSMMGFTVEGRPAGRGQVDLPWLLGLLRATGVDCNVILELWPPEQKTPQETIDLEQAWAMESIQYLRQYITD